MKHSVFLYDIKDPHSYVGNGNKRDNSLDGFICRNVLMHYLCSGLTNKNRINILRLFKYLII